MNLVQPFEVPQPVKLTVDDFLLLAESGAFDHLPSKVELLDGVITAMSPQYTKHALVVTQLTVRLQNRLTELNSSLMAIINATLTSRPSNAPEPDIFLTTHARSEGYSAAAHAPLVIEVSHTTARHDLGKKRHIYAGAGVPEYWVFDIPKAAIHRFWDPKDADYAMRDAIAVPGHVASVLVPELYVETDGLI